MNRAQKCVIQTKHAYDVVSRLFKIRSYTIISHGPNPSFNDFAFNKNTSDDDFNGLLNEECSTSIKFLSVGPFFPYKDYLYVLEVLALLGDDGFDFSYTIVGGIGDGHYYRGVKEKIGNLNLSLYVKLVGNCSLSQVKDYCINSDILIFSSLCETFWITILEALQAFSEVESTRLKLLTIGSIPADQKTVLDSLILKDSRINFLGWKSSRELIEYLSAADIYFQPGAQSETMQNAICCGTAVALYPYSSHQPYLKNNVFFVKNKEDYSSVFNRLLDDPTISTSMSRVSYHLAREILDYKILASWFINNFK